MLAEAWPNTQDILQRYGAGRRNRTVQFLRQLGRAAQKMGLQATHLQS
jgi:hypothetical protein